MINRKMKSVTLLILSLLIFAGCSLFESSKEEKEPPKKVVTVPPTPNLDKCKNYTEAGKLMIDSIINGVYEDNYELYSRDFTEKNKKYFNQEVFNEASLAIQDELGKIKSKEYVGFWVKGKYHILLWKAQFTDTEDDILIEMYITKDEEGHYRIAAVKLI